MKAMLKRLIIKRFRSFPQDSVKFDNPTFLVGRNGSGKSNFTDAFAFLAEAMASPLQAVFDKRGGINSVRNKTSGKGYPPNMGLGVELGELNGSVIGGRFAFEVRALKNYAFEVVREQCLLRLRNGERYWYDRARRFSSNVKGLNPSLDPASLCLPVVGGDERFAPVLRALGGMRVYSIQPGRLREMQDPDSGAILRSDGSNATSVLQELHRSAPDKVRRACEMMETIVPNTKTVRPKKHGNKLSLEFTQQWSPAGMLKFEAFNMSDGTLRALGLLMAVFQQPSPSLLAIEEPEATIHPGALGAVLDVLQHASRNMQVLVTTHSPELLDAKWIKDQHVRIVTWSEGASHVRPPSDAARKAIQGHLMGAGDLLRSNALEPADLFVDAEHLRDGDLFEDIK